ncbi:hypothetical protein IFM89_034341 [Coptis chinensis]|uniref:Transposase MuDR plant domain-containing protein n=1 Tax=Coptis chinensis TaxID=261450 RepID=A0A835HD30_9MAGN|nr:hypothetical protein IFM89_034341 [Coptis chinensis]
MLWMLWNPSCLQSVNDVLWMTGNMYWVHLIRETFDEVTLGETFIDGDGDALDDKDRSDDEGDKMYKYGSDFGPGFEMLHTNNDEWSAEDEDEEDYNYNPSDSDYSVCGTDDEVLDEMEPMEEEVQNLEEKIQGSDSSVVRVSTNIFEAEEMAKLTRPTVENVFVCDLKPKMSWPTVEACRDFFINLAIRKKFSYRHLKNDKERLILEYKDFNCQWKVSASVTKETITHSFLGSFGPKIHVRVLMLEKINGNYEVGYQVVPEMCRQIEKSNPGSLAKWFVKDSNQTFVGVVIAFKGSLDGWVTGCRPVIGLDGCFLKGENKDTWRLFVRIEATSHQAQGKS